jgi:GH18 family chitinase
LLEIDDVQSLQEKAKYLREKGLGGAMFWSLDTDDFNGKHGDQVRYFQSLLIQMTT